MGCFYIMSAHDTDNTSLIKIGETKRLGYRTRLSQLNRDNKCHYDCLGYLLLKDETVAQRLFVESYVRLKLEQQATYLKHTKLDHFYFNEAEPVESMLNEIFAYAQEACKMAQIKYKRGKLDYIELLNELELKRLDR